VICYIQIIEGFAMSLLSQKHLQNEEDAYKWVEARIWPNGAQCPHCFEQKRVSKMEGKATRFGLYKCYACRKQFRVTVGTIFEKSHVPLYLWLQAFYLIAGSKKGISANQLHRTLGVTLKTAWFMGHRIREAMRTGSLVPPMGGDGKVVEVDETVYGRTSSHPKGRQTFRSSQHKNIIVSLVERGGSVRSYHVAGSTVADVIPIINANVKRESAIMTDAAQLYKFQLSHFASHDRVDHGKDEYVRYVAEGPTVHSNTVEGYFSVFKRGMRGTYQHCKEKHLHRYLAEFDFRYNNRIALGIDDETRASKMIKGAQGKRLTYRTTGRA
jgi:transposase-like protein